MSDPSPLQTFARICDEFLSMPDFEVRTDELVRVFVRVPNESWVFEGFMVDPETVQLSAALRDLRRAEEYDEVEQTITEYQSRVPEHLDGTIFVEDDGWVVYAKSYVTAEETALREAVRVFVEWRSALSEC